MSKRPAATELDPATFNDQGDIQQDMTGRKNKDPRRPEARTTARGDSSPATPGGRSRRAAASVSRPEHGADVAPAAASDDPAPGSAERSAQDTPVVLAIALLVAVSYFPALQGGFVWDDVIFSGEPVIHSPAGLRSIWFSPADIKNEGHYWPLVYTSFWLEHKVWGLNPVGYHAVNILLHLANCLLLWRLLDRLAIPGAVLIAAVFAVHPLHVESVAWIIERKDVLSALCYLTAVHTWVRFDESPGPGRYVLALVLFAAGLLCKSVVVTLPVALLILHWWRRGRIAPVDLLRLAPFVAVGVGITLADLAFYAAREPLELGYSLVERALIAARALWFYAGKLVWPMDLAVIYPLWEIDARALPAWAYLAGAAALAAGLWLARHRIGRGPLAGALLFAVTLAPVLGFIDYGYMQFSFVADRFQYLAGIGVLTVLIGAAAHGMRRLPHGMRRLPHGMRGLPEAARMAAAGLAVALVLGLAMLTWRQAGVYRDEVTLFSHVVALNPQARDAHLNLGNALIEAGRNEDGVAASRIAVEQRPDSADAHSNLGLALMNLERFEEAGEALRRARALDPTHQSSLQNSAELLRKQGRYEAAVDAYRAVLQRDGRYALAYAGLGDALYQLQRYEAAVDALGTALEIDPGLPFAGKLSLLMGRAARSLGQLDRAEELYRDALAADPNEAAGLLELAGVLRAQGRRDEAEALMSRARELRPNDPAHLQTIAEALRKEQRYEEALAAYRDVLAIAPDYAFAHAGMGDTLFRLERFEEALGAMERALAAQPDQEVAGVLHSLAGQAAQHLGRIDEAARHYAEAVRIDPRDSSSLDRLAMVRFGQKQYQEALVLYRNLLELTPDSAQTYSNLGATLYYLGRADEALRHFERAVAIEPDLETARAGLEALRAPAGNP